MVVVENNGESFKIRNKTATILEENGYIIASQKQPSLYHPASNYSMANIRFYANALHEDDEPISHKKVLCGKV